MLFEFLYSKFKKLSNSTLGKPMKCIQKFLKNMLQFLCPHMLFNFFWRAELFSDDKKPYFKICQVCGREKEVVDNCENSKGKLEWK